MAGHRGRHPQRVRQPKHPSPVAQVPQRARRAQRLAAPGPDDGRRSRRLRHEATSRRQADGQQHRAPAHRSRPPLSGPLPPTRTPDTQPRARATPAPEVAPTPPRKATGNLRSETPEPSRAAATIRRVQRRNLERQQGPNHHTPASPRTSTAGSRTADLGRREERRTNRTTRKDEPAPRSVPRPHAHRNDRQMESLLRSAHRTHDARQPPTRSMAPSPTRRHTERKPTSRPAGTGRHLRHSRQPGPERRTGTRGTARPTAQPRQDHAHRRMRPHPDTGSPWTRRNVRSRHPGLLHRTAREQRPHRSRAHGRLTHGPGHQQPHRPPTDRTMTRCRRCPRPQGGLRPRRLRSLDADGTCPKRPHGTPRRAPAPPGRGAPGRSTQPAHPPLRCRFRTAPGAAYSSECVHPLSTPPRPQSQSRS